MELGILGPSFFPCRRFLISRHSSTTFFTICPTKLEIISSNNLTKKKEEKSKAGEGKIKFACIFL